MSNVKVPVEYAGFDYGFSGVDSPEAPPPVQVKQEVSDDLVAKINTLEEKIDSLVEFVHGTYTGIKDAGEGTKTEFELRNDIHTLESIIIPLLNNLLKTADKPYIYWPNREETIQAQIKRVLEITRP